MSVKSRLDRLDKHYGTLNTLAGLCEECEGSTRIHRADQFLGQPKPPRPEGSCHCGAHVTYIVVVEPDGEHAEES